LLCSIEATNIAVWVVALNDPSKVGPGHKSHHLCEPGLVRTYRYSTGRGIIQKYLKKWNLSSNRYQNKSSGKDDEYWISFKIGSTKPHSSEILNILGKTTSGNGNERTMK
jgi:hypothetical protein